MAQATSTLWKTLIKMNGTRREYYFDIDGVQYGKDSEVSHKVEKSLYDSFGIGNATIAKLTLSLFANEIPRGATIKRFVRLVNGDQTSEWISSGVFFTNHRSEDDGLWTIEAFDIMRKAEWVWAPDQSLEFPMPMPDAVREFAKIMGVEIDPRTSLNPYYTIDYPANDYTIRQELQFIAAAHGGNWIITDEGKLLLISIGYESELTHILGDEGGAGILVGGVFIRIGSTITEPSKESIEDDENAHYVGFDITNFKDNKKKLPISRITFFVDDNNVITSGDDTGFEIVADCPHATQVMADSILSRVKGYKYHAYTADAANIDPASELGDGVLVDENTFGVLAEINDDGYGYPDITAPGSQELEDEYPTVGPVTAAFNRKIAETYSYIYKTSEEIRLGVANDLAGLKSEIQILLDQIRLYVDNQDNETRGEILIKSDEILLQVQDRINQLQSMIDINLDEILLSIQDDLNGLRSLIDLKLGEISLEVTETADETGQVSAKITLKIGPNSYSGYIKMQGNIDISGQLSADALYAPMGDIADLTVDRLSTSRRIVKYLAKDLSDDNFIKIEGQRIDLITGTTNGAETQAESPLGGLLYWEADISEADIAYNGYPYIDGERVFTTTTETPWPVKVYVYDELVKRSINFEKDENGIYTPIDTYGSGTDSNPYSTKDKGFIQKRTNSFDMWLHTKKGKDLGLFIGEEYLDLIGARKTAGLNFEDWDNGQFVERVDGDGERHIFNVEFDAQQRPVKITDDDGHECFITW